MKTFYLLYYFISGVIVKGEQAFFFMDDMLLLPAGLSGLTTGNSLSVEGAFDARFPVELAKDFDNPDVFQIQAVKTAVFPALSKITVVSVPKETILPVNWKSIPVRQAITIVSHEHLGRMLRSCHIARWRKESLFCGSCGIKNTELSDNAQRICPSCGRIEFPRICPAVITIITDKQNRILLAHNKNFKEGLYSLIAGFNEAGESLEETVVREIYEEINIEVKDIVYVKSQAWPFPNSLMLGFKALYSSGTIKTDGIEITDAHWFTRENLPELPGGGSISRFLIDCWLNGTLYKA
jgi:NAD+ diphosphatase